MACAGAPSFDTPCPLPLDQQTVAWGFVGTTLCLVAGGVSLFWLQRHDHLVSKRDWLSTACLVTATLLTQVSVYLGTSVPCWAYYALNYTVAASIPGLLIARFFGIYARHLRQNAMHQTLQGSVFRRFVGVPEGGTTETKADAPRVIMSSAAPVHAGQACELSAEPSKEPRVEALPCSEAYIIWMAYVLLLYRIDQPRRGILGALLTVIPWLAYAAVRFATSPSHCLGTTGCQFDVVDVSVVVIISGLALSTAIPAVMRVSQIPDRLLLRYDGIAQLVIWPPLLTWLLTDLSLPNGSHTALHGIYGPLIGCLVTVVVSVWVPAVLSCCRRSSRTVLPRRLDSASSPRLATSRAFPRLVRSREFDPVPVHASLGGARGVERRMARSSSSSSTPRSPRLGVCPVDGPGELEQPQVRWVLHRKRNVDALRDHSQALDPQVVASYEVNVEQAAPQAPALASHYSTAENILSARQLSCHQAVVIESDVPPVPVRRASSLPTASNCDVSATEMSALLRVACRFVHPDPSAAEVLATLARQAADISRDSNSRELAILCALLFATKPGRVLLLDTLRLDLSAELLGFLVDCENLRSIAEEWLPRVMIDGDEAPLPPLVGVAADSLCAEFHSALCSIYAQFVDFSAPHYISMSGSASSVLRQATRDLMFLQDNVARNENGAEAAAAGVAERAMAAIASAEMDVFEMVVDPLRQHMQHFPGLFDTWAAATVRGLRARTSNDDVQVASTYR